MALPRYTPTHDFSLDETINVSGRSTVRTASLDTELGNLATVADALADRIEGVTRDDGNLADRSVTRASLSAEVVAMINGRSTVPTMTFATYADVLVSGATPYFFVVLADETNDGARTTYFYDGAAVNWLPLVEI